MVEYCIFCGWTRSQVPKAVHFYSVPSEPGLKRLRWLQLIQNKLGDMKFTRSVQKVCGIHFKGLKPSNDQTHIDFVPHMYMSSDEELPNELIQRIYQLQGQIYPSDAMYILNNENQAGTSSSAGQSNPLKRPGSKRPPLLKDKRPRLHVKQNEIAEQSSAKPNVNRTNQGIESDESEQVDVLQTSEEKPPTEHEEHPELEEEITIEAEQPLQSEHIAVVDEQSQS